MSDAWVALHTSRPEHNHPVQVFAPYQTIFRVEVHPGADPGQRHLGFMLAPPTAIEPAGDAAAARARKGH